MTNRQAAIRIIKRLRKHGHQALLAGGCVRDMLLNRAAKDYDVATSARPDEVIRLFERTIRVGAKFGVVMVMIGSEQVEVATFRTESGYADHRHPSQVAFSNAKEDASRRDFTINGMFYDPVENQVIDYVGGQDDLRPGIIRTIGDPRHRFGEDYLRLMRAVRFATRLNFTIEPETWRAVQELSGRIEKISRERVAMELEAILSHPNRRRGAELLEESGLCRAIFGKVDPSVLEFGREVLGFLPKQVDFPLALAGFFAGEETKNALRECANLRLSNSHTRGLRYLLENRGVLLEEDIPLARLKLLLAEPYFQDLYNLQWAVQSARSQSVGPLKAIHSRARELEGVELRPKPLLDGHALIEMGVRPGPMVGHVGREMYIAQLSERINTPEQAREWVSAWLDDHKEIS